MSVNEKKAAESASTEPDETTATEKDSASADTDSTATPEGVVEAGIEELVGEPAEGDADALGFGDARMEPESVDAADLEGGPVDIDALNAKLAEETARADGNWERVLRMQADMENQRKRLQKEVENARKFALEGVVNDLLPVKDSLEMGIAAARETDADPSKIIEGSDLTLKMLAQAFEKYNIVEINPVDQKFDPEFHQAMSAQEVEGKAPNMVTTVLQKGYTLNERLIRPALVMVSK